MLVKAHRTVSPFQRHQIRYVLAATTTGLLALGIYFLVTYRWHLPPVHYLVEIVVVLTLAYAIVRHRLMEINVVLTRAAVFTFCYLPLLLLPITYGIFFESVLSAQFGRRWWVLTTVAEAILAVVGLLVYRYVRQKAEDRLLAEQRRYQTALRQASQGMTLIKDLDRLLKLLVYYLTHKVPLKHASIYLWDRQTKQFVLRSMRQRHNKATLTLGKDHPFTLYLQNDRMPLVTEELSHTLSEGKKDLQPIVNTLKELDAAVVIPSFVAETCMGFLVLGEKVSGGLYTHDDLEVFQVLANQAALAIENAQFYEELKRTQADLFQTAKMASLGHMAGGMSHQINNRFHVLTILAGTLKSTLKLVDPVSLDKEKLKEFWARGIETLNKIEENALRGGDIVKTLLKFSRPAGEYKPVNVQHILNTAKEVVQFRVNLGVFDILEEIPENLPPIKGDMNQLADCCINLIANAFDATQKKAELVQVGQTAPGAEDSAPYRGQVSIRASSLDSFNGKSWVILEIRDNGTGMSKEDAHQLFVPFFTTKATAEKGTGLGLYIIQRIIEQHGGTIQAKSDHGHGTTFTIQLPSITEQNG